MAKRLMGAEAFEPPINGSGEAVRRAQPDQRLKGIGSPAAHARKLGFTGREDYLKSVAGLARPRWARRVRILVSSTEIGQGTNTILCQIVAETLGIDYDAVEIAKPDGQASPNSGPIGVADVHDRGQAGRELRRSGCGRRARTVRLVSCRGLRRCGVFRGQYQAPPGARGRCHQGDAHGAPRGLQGTASATATSRAR